MTEKDKNEKLPNKIQGKNKSKPKIILDKVVQISTVAWTIAANIAIGVFGGNWIDKLLGTYPFFLIILSLLGLISAVLYIFSFAGKPKKKS